MPYCTQCGCDNSAEASFCEECGAKLRVAAVHTSSTRRSEQAYSSMQPANASSMVDSALNSALTMAARPVEQDKSCDANPVRDATLVERYKDGYKYARFLIIQGTAIKVVGWIVGVVSLMILFPAVGNLFRAAQIAGSESGLLGIIAAVLLSALIGHTIFAIGVMFCARGQLLKAMFDCAVHTSPFMSNRLRAEAMSLKTTESIIGDGEHNLSILSLR